MPVKTAELIEAIEDLAPPGIQESFDNSGWQINLHKDEVRRALISLEMTNAVIDEAKARHADFILTHHPLLFSPLKCIDIKSESGGYAIELIKSGIQVYSAHTSFDSADGGMNDGLAALLGLRSVEQFPEPAPGGRSMGRKGLLKDTMPFREVCEMTKEELMLSAPIRAVGPPDRMISKVAVCGGGGGDLTEDAVAEGMDLYISGDIKHHQGHRAFDSGLCLIDAGHYGTEKHFVEMFSLWLLEAFGSRLDIERSAICLDPFNVV